MQLRAVPAGTFEIAVACDRRMPAHLADKPSVHMRNHGPELHAENAIGTANHGLGHGNFESDGESKDQRSIANLVTAAFAVR